MNDIESAKNNLRKTISAQRKKLTTNEIYLFSEQIVKQIETLPAFLNARHILAYFPIHNEVDIMLLVEKWENEKQFLLPVVRGENMEMRLYEGKSKLASGAFGISEPISESFNVTPDLILAPGVAFDVHGNRMGRGKGFYDRFLEKHHTEVWGVCYDFQLINQIPTTHFDKKMDKIITPTQLIEA